MRIELTEKEADLLTDYLTDAEELAAKDCPLERLWKFQQRYAYATRAGKTIDKIWVRIADQIGKMDFED